MKLKSIFTISGEISMQKVKVQRYVSGKIPQYAKKVSSDESSGEDDFLENRKSITFNKLRDVAAQEEQDDDR